MALRDIMQARNRRRRELRDTLQDRSRTGEARLAGHRGDLHGDDQMMPDAPAITRGIDPVYGETRRLKRYIHE